MNVRTRWFSSHRGSKEDGVVPDLLFLKVPDDKCVKNRLHLDLRPVDQVAEVDRLKSLGAHRVFVGQGDDASWVVLADPEGNEFCVLRSVPLDDEGQPDADQDVEDGTELGVRAGDHPVEPEMDKVPDPVQEPAGGHDVAAGVGVESEAHQGECSEADDPEGLGPQ